MMRVANLAREWFFVIIRDLYSPELIDRTLAPVRFAQHQPDR